MIPDMVADVGNTRVKWAICESGGIVGAPLSLPHDPASWELKRAELPSRHFRWVVASVRPDVSDRLIEWLRGRGEEAMQLRREQLPLQVNVEQPGRVGIDRLLNAIAAKSVLGEGKPAVLVDAGSAVTVDYLDEAHVFQGGTIFPGLDLMAEALHRYTALLPRIEVLLPVPDAPGKSTAQAIQAGIFHAVAGGIDRLISRYRKLAATPPQIYLTGGQAPQLSTAVCAGSVMWPQMTLHGILVAARGMS